MIYALQFFCKELTMGTLIITLQVIFLLIDFGCTESTEPLQCFNDYDTELKCRLHLDEPDSCSENVLKAVKHNEVFTGHFNQILPGACECRIQVLSRFIVSEIFTMNVAKGNETWHRQQISTEESIKPRRPIITSIKQKNGNFLITLNTTYTKNTFSDYLMVELMYYINGSNENVRQLLTRGQTTYEIVGRNLQPNSKYILKARMKSAYPPNKTFSDYSEPYVFETPFSLQNILKIIIPITCLILIICISSIYFWFNRIVQPWFDMIPTPNLSTNFVKQVPQLLSFQTSQFSPVYLDTTTNHSTKITSVESTQVQNEDLSLGQSENSTSLMYFTANNKNVDKSSSEFSNSSYMQSDSSSLSFYNQKVTKKSPSENFQLSNNQGPLIETDLNYSMLNGCTESGSSRLVHIMPNSNKIPVVYAYEPMGVHDALSSCNDSIIEKPQGVPCSVHITVEEEYQPFLSVAKTLENERE